MCVFLHSTHAYLCFWLPTFAGSYTHLHRHIHICYLSKSVFCARVSGCRRGAAGDAWSQGVAFKLCVLNVQCSVPPQVDEIECIIPAYKGLALK